MKIKRVKLGESNATEYTYDSGEVWTIVDNPQFDGSVVAEGPKQTIKWEVFDFGAPTPQVPNSDKLIEMYKEGEKDRDIVMQVTKQEAEAFHKALEEQVKRFTSPEGTKALHGIWKKPEITKNMTRFGAEYFKGLEVFLKDYGFEPTKLPWRYESDRYSIIQLEDSDGNEEINPTIYGISITSDDEQVYRGRLFNSTHAAYIFGMVAEHRLLTGKDDFPKLPIEPVKFAVGRTSVWLDEEKTDELYPETVQEVIETTCPNDAYKTFDLRTKEFYTAAELIGYMKLVKHPIVIDNEWGSCTDSGLPRLEIYDDYRE
jgi:hypothetical protein